MILVLNVEFPWQPSSPFVNYITTTSYVSIVQQDKAGSEIAKLLSYSKFCPGPKVIKPFSWSTQLSMKFELLIKTKMLKNQDFFASKLSDVECIMLINVKMPTTIVGILTFMSRINFVLR